MFETCMLTGTGRLMRTLPAHVIARLQRARARCMRCRQSIAPSVNAIVRGAHVFHPSCARRQAIVPAVAAAQPPRIIGTVVGVAVPYNQDGFIERPSEFPTGGFMERIDRDAFRDSVVAGGQHVAVDHAAHVPGVLTLFNEPDALRFRFRVHHSPLGQSVMQRAQAGAFRGVSIGFKEARSTYDGGINVITSARLTEVSLCYRGRPAWHSTSVWAEV